MLFFPNEIGGRRDDSEPDWTRFNIRCCAYCINMCEQVLIQSMWSNCRSKTCEVMSVTGINHHSNADANNHTMTSAVSAFTPNYNFWLFWHNQTRHIKRLLLFHLMKYWNIIIVAKGSFIVVIFTWFTFTNKFKVKKINLFILRQRLNRVYRLWFRISVAQIHKE